MTMLRRTFRLLIVLGLAVVFTVGATGSAQAVDLKSPKDPINKVLAVVCSGIQMLDPVDDYVFCLKL